MMNHGLTFNYDLTFRLRCDIMRRFLELASINKRGKIRA